MVHKKNLKEPYKSAGTQNNAASEPTLLMTPIVALKIALAVRLSLLTSHNTPLSVRRTCCGETIA